jgi:hypothetical protein
MQLRIFVASLAVIVATATPVLAAEYWVSQKPTANKKCKVVDKMPDGKTYVMVGATSYPTKDAAKAAMQVAIDAGQCTKTKK